MGSDRRKERKEADSTITNETKRYQLPYTEAHL